MMTIRLVGTLTAWAAGAASANSTSVPAMVRLADSDLGAVVAMCCAPLEIGSRRGR